MSIIKKLALALLLALPLGAGAATITEEVDGETSDTGATPNTSDAFDPEVGDLLVVITSLPNSGTNTPTLVSSIGGNTFTKVTAGSWPTTPDNWVHIWVADQLIASGEDISQTVTLSDTADEGTGSNMVVLAVAGMSKVGFDGSGNDAIQQVGTPDNDNSAGATPTVPFGGAFDTNNPTIGAVAVLLNPSAITEPTGWTETAEISFASPNNALEVVFRNSGSTASSLVWGSTYGQVGAAVAIELDASAAGTPVSFTAGPTRVAATNGHTVGGTLTGSGFGALVAYAVGVSPGDGAPTCTQIKAGQNDGGTAALLAASETWTTTVANDFALAAANSIARMDVHVCASDGTNDTSVTTFSDADRSARAGFALIAHTSVATTSICDLDSYFNPDCASGDVFEYEDDTNESADCNISFEADGDFVLTPAAPGDCDGLRTFEISYEDVSSATTGLFTAPSVGNFTTDDTVYVNNTPPACSIDPENEIVLLIEDEAMAARDMADLGSCTDEDGHQMSASITAGTLPATTALGGTGNLAWTGTPGTEDENGEAITVQISDPAGDSDTYEFTVYTVNTWTVPDVVGMTVSAAQDAVVAAAAWRLNDPNVVATAQECSEEPAGEILSQSPAASAEAEPSDPIEVTVAEDCGAATWVSYARVWMFREVRKVYLTTTGFKEAVEDELRGSAAWARWAPGTLPWSGSSNMQIDVTSIPGVPALTSGGQIAQ